MTQAETDAQTRSEWATIQDAVTEYVRDWILGCKRRDMSYRAIAERLEVTHAWVIQIAQPEKYGHRSAGPELELALARILHDGSIDSLRKAALSFYRDHGHKPDVLIEGQRAPKER